LYLFIKQILKEKVLFKILLYLILFIFLFKSFNYGRSIFKLDLNFSTFFCVSLFLYTFFVIVENQFLNPNGVQTIDFYWEIILLILALISGVLFSKLLRLNFPKKHTKFTELSKSKISKFKFNLVTVLVAVCCVVYIDLIFGGFTTFFNQRYGEFNADNMNSFSSIIPLLITSYILLFNLNASTYLTNKQNRIVVYLSFFYISIFMIGGNRNISIMMAISLFYSRFYDNKINIVKYIPVFIILILLSSVIAVGREYGFINYITSSTIIENSDFWRYAMNFGGGEFGTMYRVMNYSNEFVFDSLNFSLYSYIISPFEQMIPTIIYPSRQYSIAVEFTKQYWGGLSVGSIGLGFSPIFEAKISLGNFWPLIFVFFGFLIEYFRVVLKNRNAYLVIGAFSAVSLNFFRIDFALFFKFFLLIYLFTFIMRKFVKINV